LTQQGREYGARPLDDYRFQQGSKVIMHSFLTRSILRRTAAAILAGALIAGTIGLTPAQAAHHHWHHRNAAVFGAVAGLFGTIAAIAAADQYRDAYYDGGPYYYGYGGPYVYGPSYGGYGHWHGGHRGYHGHHHH
jgi:hypothetical protein